MFESIRPLHSRIIRRKQRAQTLIVAIAVLFILLFIGVLFVAQIARNIVFSGRSRDTQTAQALAEAGIHYCDDELTNSADGADWRPAPTPPITSLKDPFGVSDPDYEWLSQGFARYPEKGGRALVRVTYDPHPDDPRSQFIKIESIGRPGELGNGNDPTVFVQNGAAPRLRRELIAYKQLALTDYVRFITNRYKNATDNALGTPAIGHYAATVFNDPTAAGHPDGLNNNEVLIGGGIRCNGNLRFVGDVFIYTSTRGTSDPLLSGEGVFASGNILLGPTRDVNGDGVVNDQDYMVYLNQQINDPALLTNPASLQGNTIHSSNDTVNGFDTHGGVVRDGSNQPDIKGYARSIPRLDPPLIDTFVSGSGVLRYRALTRDSGIWVNNGGQHYNTGQNGWGSGIYVNNPTDLQAETTNPTIPGGYSLPRDWVNPKAGYAQSAWVGPFYRPPGLTVQMMGDHLRLTRSDGNVFTEPDGTKITANAGLQEDIPLDDEERSAAVPGGQDYTFPGTGDVFRLPLYPHDGDDTSVAGRPYGDTNSYGVNVVIFAEGNVRILGYYGAVTDSRDTTKHHLGRVHITIVTGGTAYIEGNIVKNDGYLDNNGTLVVERNSTCAILAHDYVCVNTTMFMNPQNQVGVWKPFNNPAEPNLDAFYAEVGSGGVPTYDAGFSFGVNPSTYQIGGNPVTPFLLLRHATIDPGPSYLNLLLNPALDVGGSSLYQFNVPAVPPVPATTDPIGYMVAGGAWVADPEAVAPDFDQRGFPLDAVHQTTGIPTPGFTNLFRFQLDNSFPGIPGAGGPQDYLLGGAMVVPLDIRIEAVLYAQNRSFFVIPGYNFNPEPTDSRQNFTRNGYRYAYDTTSPSASDKAAKDLFPYYGEPMDVRITVYGAVAENYTASQGDQTAWLQRWGYIPATYGSSATVTPDDHHFVHDPAGYNPAEDRTQDFRTPFEQGGASNDFEYTHGLRFVYDPALAMPYQHPTDPGLSGDVNAVRPQRALRFIDRPAIVINGTQVLPEIRQMLPSLPRLPVCPGLLYFGDSDRPIS